MPDFRVKNYIKKEKAFYLPYRNIDFLINDLQLLSNVDGHNKYS